jgi:predicted O-methyltransferase YrrM
MRVDSSSTFQIKDWPHRSVRCGPHAWSVLAAFSRPRRMSEVLAELGAGLSGRQDWVDLSTTIVGLYEAGILRDEDAASAPLTFMPDGYAGPEIHIAMLNDRARTSKFLEGIREVVRAGDVVVDIGTGTGVLAVAAAKAGARRVYAIEASAIDTVAERIFEVNGVADRVTLVRGWSSQVTLPERADVLVSEMLGHEPLSEQVLELTLDATKRLLKPNARMVPDRVRVLGLPVTVPRARAEKHAVAPHVDNWRDWYGIDFSPFAEASTAPITQASVVDPYLARSWEAVATPVLLADIDLKAIEAISIENEVVFEATSAGELTGVLVYFELDLGPTTTLSLHPARVAPDNHWRCSLFVLLPGFTVAAGDRFAMTYRYGRSAPGICALRRVTG